MGAVLTNTPGLWLDWGHGRHFQLREKRGRRAGLPRAPSLPWEWVQGTPTWPAGHLTGTGMGVCSGLRPPRKPTSPAPSRAQSALGGPSPQPRWSSSSSWLQPCSLPVWGYLGSGQTRAPPPIALGLNNQKSRRLCSKKAAAGGGGVQQGDGPEAFLSREAAGREPGCGRPCPARRRPQGPSKGRPSGSPTI